MAPIAHHWDHQSFVTAIVCKYSLEAVSQVEEAFHARDLTLEQLGLDLRSVKLLEVNTQRTWTALLNEATTRRCERPL